MLCKQRTKILVQNFLVYSYNVLQEHSGNWCHLVSLAVIQ